MSAAQTSTSMDAVNTAAQDTGVSSQNLADSLKLVAPAASNLKIPFNDAVYDMALFQGAGLKTTAVNTAMQKTFTDAAKSGQDANTRWTEDVATLQTYVTQGNNAGISTKAWTQLTDDFGTRSLPTMTAGLKDGSTKFQNLKTDIDNGKPSIENTAAATETFSQKFDTLKHSVELALAPLGTTMITTLTNVGTTLKPVLSAVETLGKDFSALPAPVQTTILVIGLAVAALGPMLSAVNYVAGALTTMGGIVTTVGTKLGILSADEATTGTATATMSGEVDTATVSLTAEGAAGDTAATGLDASATAAVGAEGAMVGLSTAIAGVVVAYYALKVSAQLADTAVKQTNADAKASTGGDSTVTSKPPSSTTENTTVPGYGQLNVAATGGLVTASGIQHFAGGGMVDTVPAMLTPGELVLTPGQAGALASGGGNYTFNIAFNNATLTSQADADNFSRQIAWSAKEEIRRSGVSRG